MRPKKDLYPQEQTHIKDSLIKILGLDENPSIIRYYLDHDNHLINQIMSLTPSIRKYFSFSSITGVMEPETLQRPYLSIIKNLLKDRFIIQSKDIKLRLSDGHRIRTTQYFFIPK